MINKLYNETNQNQGFKIILVTLSVLAVGCLRGINSAASCQYRYIDANMDMKRRKQLLQLLNQSNAPNILYDSENGEQVQLITEFFIDKPTSDDEEGVRFTGGAKQHKTSDELENTTPLVIMCRAQSSVEIQNNAGSSFPTTDAAASFACKCTQHITWRALNYRWSRDRDTSHNFLSILMTKLSNFNWTFTIICCGKSFDHFQR